MPNKMQKTLKRFLHKTVGQQQKIKTENRKSFWYKFEIKIGRKGFEFSKRAIADKNAI